ncbi:MAG: hypothetical protein J6C62_03995 [Clostridia bacterium]|nr:hypothetical protein [Clostridia bacterium]
MKTLKQNKLFNIFFSIFMALCAVLGILSTVPRPASADEAGFDWSKYDDPANYTETTLKKGDNLTLSNKVIKITPNSTNKTYARAQFTFSEDVALIIGTEHNKIFYEDMEYPAHFPFLSMNPEFYDRGLTSVGQASDVCWLPVRAGEGEEVGIYYKLTEEATYIYIEDGAYFYENNASSIGTLSGPVITDSTAWVKRIIPSTMCEFEGTILSESEINAEAGDIYNCDVSILELNKQNNPGTGSGGSSINGNDTKPESAEKMDVTEIVFLVALAFGELILLTLCAMKLPRSGKWFTLLVLLLIFVGFDLILYMNFIGMI